MRHLILILLSISAVQSQTEWQRWRDQRDKEIRTERQIYAVANYSLGALFAVLDASQDAITYSPNKETKWGLNHGDYHAIKTWRNISIIGCGISLGGRTISDISYEEGTGRVIQRLLVRLFGIGMVNYIQWDFAYNSNRYGRPISLDPARYQHWSGIDFVDKYTKPTTRVDVVYIHVLKFGLAATAILLDCYYESL